MKKGNKKWLKIGIFACLLGIVILRYHSYLLEGLREIAGISMAKKAGIFLASAGYMLAEGRIIERMAKVFHINIRWRTGVGCAYYCSFARIATFGGGAGAAEIYYLSNEGMEPAHALDVSLIQYLCQKVSVTLAGVLSLLVFFQDAEASIGEYRKYLVYGVALAVLVVLGILLALLSKRAAGLLFRLFDWAGEKKENWKSKTEAWKDQVRFSQDGVKVILQEKGRLAEILGWNMVKYFCWFCIPYILYQDSGALSLFSSAGMMAIATVMASVIPVPAGYGALEFMQLMLFEPALGSGRAVSLMILYRAATTFLPALIGAAAAFVHKRKKKDAFQK